MYVISMLNKTLNCKRRFIYSLILVTIVYYIIEQSNYANYAQLENILEVLGYFEVRPQ